MRRIVSQAQFARYIGKHHSTVCNYIRHRILTRRPDRKLDLHQADRELSEYFDRPRRFRDGLDAELMEWRVRNTKLLGELIPHKRITSASSGKRALGYRTPQPVATCGASCSMKQTVT